jgi:predicted alpha/beta-hydrolase family hydrolase
MSDRGMVRAAEVLRAAGLDLVRFNFLYTEMGSRRPDSMRALRACMSAVVSHVRSELGPRRLIMGGRSMGGRVASMMAAERHDACDALLLLSYPLHPAGQPDRLRDAHLSGITQPVLCINGTRDALCRRDLMERALQTVRAPWQMHWLAGADHSFHVLKSSGRTDDDVFAEVGDVARGWLRQLADEILACSKRTP